MNWPVAVCYCVTIVCLAISFEVWVNRNKPYVKDEEKHEYYPGTNERMD